MPTTDTIFVQNPTNELVCVPGFPAFVAGEVREVSQEDAQILLANPYLVESSTVDSSDTTDSKKKSTSKKAD